MENQPGEGDLADACDKVEAQVQVLDCVRDAAEGLRADEGEHVAVHVDDLERVEVIKGAAGDLSDDVVGEGELLQVRRGRHQLCVDGPDPVVVRLESL